ncbi:hypothetical protein SLEP1_g25927 [Rubroshorea leprosula]|uniref:Leucine-rich repeat-containing N-terminal plant-type domain-containing protein n=1 Tax=Rubroshorea leprosula TaxID=152421 RepID=A0AAV5JSM8_9ROSI|nr:hypothetical protein SLEP1_g25927 [Rubroshorea leprosula]
MGRLIWFSQILCLSFMLLQFRVQSSSSPSQSSSDSPPHVCHPGERSALLDFKSTTDVKAGYFCTPRRIIQTWNESKDCCLWEGITCDKRKGHVIGLDLSNNCLEANLTTNSSLFRLEKLQSLNLSANYFYFPNIPFRFNRWKSLRYLNLSDSRGMDGSLVFDEILLPKLVSLDLSVNYGLLLDNIKFQKLALNLTELRVLILASVNMSLVVPSSLLNLTSSLEHLSLRDCSLQGNFPSQVFHLPSLQFLDIGYNSHLRGNLPKSNWSTPLKYLYMIYTSFSGELPHSIGNLKHLEELDLYKCQFYGTIPRSLANLTEITSLDFSFNNFQVQNFGVFGKMHKLTHLIFRGNNFGGEIPTSIFNLTHLAFLSLSSNKLIGQIPSWLFSLPSLSFLDLQNNRLTRPIDHIEMPNLILQEVYLSNNEISGSIPSFFFDLMSLRKIDLSSNNLSETITPIMLSKLVDLESLDFSNNGLLSLSNNVTGVNYSFPKLQSFIFSSCNVQKFPTFLRKAKSLLVLDISKNKISGHIHKWEIEGMSMARLHLSYNFLTGIDLFDLGQLEIVDLRSNLLQGSLPIPPTVWNFRRLLISGNNLTGEIPPSYCNLNSLDILDLANNSLEGKIPECAISNSMPAFYFPKLRIIDVAQNDFMGLLSSNYFKILKGMRDAPSVEGELASIWIFKYMSRFPIYYQDSVDVVVKGQTRTLNRVLLIFTTIDFSSNRFHGPIPKELGELKSLRLLNLSHNNLTGQIPTSLGNLSKLESLDLSSNRLEGRIPQQFTDLTFLSFLNLSHNELVGQIPQGKQFNTFLNDSYIGNSGLCGFPLPKKCYNGDDPGAPPPKFDEEDDSAALFNWKFALAGYGCGLVLGLSLGYIAFITGKPWGVVKKVEKYQQKFVERWNGMHKKKKIQKPNQRS